jgi:hypothetical protein
MTEPTYPRVIATFDNSFVRCPDCRSVVVMVAHASKVSTIQVQHSTTCPAWREPGAEVAVTFMPKSEGES